MVVEAVWLHHIDNVESVESTSLNVVHLEVEPLCIAFSVVVWFQNQVVFELVHLDGSSQVSTFES